MALVSACGIPPSLMTSNSDGFVVRERAIGPDSAYQIRAKAKEIAFEAI